MIFNYSDRMTNMNGTATREIFKLLSRPEIISFAGGLPATEALPIADVRNIADYILSRPDAYKLLQYGTTEGYAPLLSECAKLVKEFGVELIPDSDMLVISGGQQGIDLMCKSFLNRGDVVLVEDPTYLAALQIFNSYEAKAVGVRSCNEGIDAEDLKNKIKRYNPKFVYLVPTFSNPTGKTYTEKNRKLIAKITAEYGVPVLEDDPYSRLRFSGNKINSVYSFSDCGNVVYLSSFSKIISPGLRVGVAVGNREIIRKMAICKQGTDLHTSLLSQAIAAEYLTRGLLNPAVNKSLPLYKSRKDAMLRDIVRYMPHEFDYTDPDGGLFIWGEFKNCDIDTAALLPQAVSRNVAYIQGSVFYADGGGKNTIRLNYSNASEDDINTGIKILGQFFKEIISKEKR